MLHQATAKLNRHIFYLVPFILLLATGTFFLQYSYYQNFLKKKGNTNYQQQEKATKAALQVQKQLPSFGYDNLLADWAFLQFVQYMGSTEAREKTGYSLAPDYFDVIVNRDPRFVNAYFYLSTASTVFAGQPQKTVNNMEKVLKHVTPDISPKAYLLWKYKAVDEMIFLGEFEAAQHSYRMAAKWVPKDLPNAEEIIARNRQTAKFLENNPNSKRAKVTGWVTILNNAPNQETRKRAIQKIEQLGGKVTIYPNGRVEVKLPEKD